MKRISICATFFSLVLALQTSTSVEYKAKTSPIKFSTKLSNNDVGEPKKDSSKGQIVMFVGYIALGLIVVSAVLYLLYKKSTKKRKVDDEQPQKPNDNIDTKCMSSTIESTERKPSFSLVSAENSAMVVTSPEEIKGLRFEDLLRAPAEMLGRGKNGSLYKVTIESGKSLVVKRIENWTISSNEFKVRMNRLGQVKHPNVLPALAFYSSRQEKLLVYEYQQHGSLFNFLHGTNNKARKFDWTSRLDVASKIAEALAFMHNELRDDNIPHGNFKSSNIFLNDAMDEPRIGEYGLTTADSSSPRAFEDDVYGLGVVLLELLTGKPVRHKGVELAEWVRAVVREEWTGEVFDKSLASKFASEERMVSLLRVAIRCVSKSHEARPSMDQVVAMVNSIKEEEDRSAMNSL